MTSNGCSPSTSVVCVSPRKEGNSPIRRQPTLAWGSEDTQILTDASTIKSERSNLARSSASAVVDFSDSEEIKERVRTSLLKPLAYNVHDFYHSHGPWQHIAKHPMFENATLGVITFNAIWIAIETDLNNADSFTKSDTIFQVMEHLFCTYFSAEWIVRFMAFRRKLDGLKDAWFVFDSTLVALMVLETWIFTIVGSFSGNGGKSPLGGNTAILRLFRLLRLSRLLRMLRSLPELMILVKGMLTAMKSVLYVMCLLIIIIFVFAIALTQLADGTKMGKEFFDSVPLSMYSLLIYGTFVDDLAYFCDTIREESYLILTLVLVFICMSCLTVMNMLIGVLCEIVSAVAKTEKEMITTRTVSEKMEGIVNELDTNLNGKISYVEFKQILDVPEALRALECVGVDPAGIVDFAELMFFEDGDHSRPKELPFDTFMGLVLDLRESNTATVKDIKYLWRQINPRIQELSKEVEDLKGRAGRMEQNLSLILDEVRQVSSGRLAQRSSNSGVTN